MQGFNNINKNRLFSTVFSVCPSVSINLMINKKTVMMHVVMTIWDWFQAYTVLAIIFNVNLQIVNPLPHMPTLGSSNSAANKKLI